MRRCAEQSARQTGGDRGRDRETATQPGKKLADAAWLINPERTT